MPNIRGKGTFKLEFVCIVERTADGGSIRAIVLAAAEIPGQPQFMTLGLAYENGTILQKTVRKGLFMAAQMRGDAVTLVEAPDVGNAPGVLLGPSGRVVEPKAD